MQETSSESLENIVSIPFPRSLSFDELTGDLFDYLATTHDTVVRYEFSGLGQAQKQDNTNRVRRLSAYIRKEEDPLGASYDLFVSDSGFSGMRMSVPPGYDSVEDFETLHSGRDQLETADFLREAVQQYFTQK